MFVHPNQLRFAVGQVTGARRVQAVITRSENRDELLLNVIPADADAELDTLAEALSQAVRSVCRVNVEQVVFVPPGELKEDAPLIVDKRRWE
jgi:hypothetical protein